MLEIWKDITGYEGLYMVSNMGRVKSLKFGKERILKPGSYDKYGHQMVVLCKDGVMTNKIVHRLVAIAFLSNPENKPEVDHIDTNPRNNSVDNLHWVTPKENRNNPLSIIHNRDAQSEKPIYCFENDIVYESVNDAARQLNLNSGNVSSCCRGLRNQTGSYHFKYYEKGEAI